MEALIRHDPGTFHLLDYEPAMHPIGAQIVGSKPELAAEAARIIEELGFDLLDFNCGCPVDKITKDGSGSGMLKNPQRIGEVLANMVAAVDIPVTVKVRAGWDEENIFAPLITKIAEEAGAKAITVHARTREQAYKGNANWEYIRQCCEAAKEIKVIGNGDLFAGADALRMQEETGCDAVMASRGTMGQPWLVEDILNASQGLPVADRSAIELKRELLEHFAHTTDYETEQGALIAVRRIGCWYFKSSSGTREFRHRISRATSVAEARELIDQFAYVAT